jgi:hypothetical protein
MTAPRDIDRADVLGELEHRFKEADPNNAIAWVLDELVELDILRYREPPHCRATEGATGVKCWLPRGHALDVDHEGTHDPETASNDGIGYRLTVRWPWQQYDPDYSDVAIPEWERELLAQESARSREPRVFSSDGPEPPADVARVINRLGDTIERIGGRWWYTTQDGQPLDPPDDESDAWLWPSGLNDGPYTEAVS